MSASAPSPVPREFTYEDYVQLGEETGWKKTNDEMYALIESRGLLVSYSDVSMASYKWKNRKTSQGELPQSERSKLGSEVGKPTNQSTRAASLTESASTSCGLSKIAGVTSAHSPVEGVAKTKIPDCLRQDHPDCYYIFVEEGNPYTAAVGPYKQIRDALDLAKKGEVKITPEAVKIAEIYLNYRYTEDRAREVDLSCPSTSWTERQDYYVRMKRYQEERKAKQIEFLRVTGEELSLVCSREIIKYLREHIVE